MNKALFLDRDGIINIDHGYVYQPENFEFVEGIFELCRDASSKGYSIIVITNQSGIARGKYTEDDFYSLSAWMIQQFKSNDVIITDIYFCPHHPNKGIGNYLKKCHCRKPKPGLILQASNEHDINLKESIFIGDKVSDMQAAEAAGIENRILVAGKYEDIQHISAKRISNLILASAFIN